MPIYESKLVNFNFGDFFMKKFSLSILMCFVSIGINGCSATGSGYSHSYNSGSGSTEDRLDRLEKQQKTQRAIRQLNSMGYNFKY